MTETESDRRALDRKILQEALQLISSCYPQAVLAVFETSDQNVGYGFSLVDIRDRAGLSLLEHASDLQRYWIRRRAEPFLMDIDWDGVMGEDAHGVGEVAITV